MQVPPHELLTLGQTAPTPGEILGPLAWIVVAAVVLAVAALGLRVWLRKSGEDDASIGPGFTLADLRAMRDTGQLDETEFAAAREKLIGATRGDAAANAETAPPPRTPPADGGIVWDESPEEDDESGAGDDPPSSVPPQG